MCFVMLSGAKHPPHTGALRSALFFISSFFVILRSSFSIIVLKKIFFIFSLINKELSVFL